MKTPDPISPEKRAQIEEELCRIEREEQVSILWCCESGSRAWGFESQDSDYDVRFIYLRKASEYLRVSEVRDVIEKPISADLDISGWDLQKALGLFRKSNPPLLEWLQSPIVYRADQIFHQEICELIPDYFSPIGCMYHYMSMAKRDRRKFLNEEELKLKKYFYMLRATLACMWIDADLGVPPIRFEDLLNQFFPDGPLREEIDQLAEKKRAGVEMDVGPRIPILSDFLIEKIDSYTDVTKSAQFTRAWAPLDAFFLQTLSRVRGNAILPPAT